MERCLTSLIKTSMFLAHTITFILDYLNHKTRSKKLGPQGVLTNEEEKKFMAWISRKNVNFQLSYSSSK
jgi:hypothetical protein